MDLSVRDFGAIGDGDHPDHAAIQATIEAATEFSTVYVPQPIGPPPMNFYRIDRPLVINKRVLV